MVRIQVADRVVIAGEAVYAETRDRVFRREAKGLMAQLEIGNRVRRLRSIGLSKWEHFKRSECVPEEYSKAIEG